MFATAKLRDEEPVERFDPEPFRAPLKAFLLRRGAGGDTDDLVQEAFLRSLVQPPRQEPMAWLTRIARNLLTDRARRDRRREGARPHLVALENDRVDVLDASDRTVASDRFARALALLSDLPPRRRIALELRLMEGFDYDAVGARIGCSSATARQHFYLAMKDLRVALGGEDDSQRGKP